MKWINKKYDTPHRGYQGQIEYFAVYSPDLDKVYLVPIDHAGASDMARYWVIMICQLGALICFAHAKRDR